MLSKEKDRVIGVDIGSTGVCVFTQKKKEPLNVYHLEKDTAKLRSDFVMTVETCGSKKDFVVEYIGDNCYAVAQKVQKENPRAKVIICGNLKKAFTSGSTNFESRMLNGESMTFDDEDIEAIFTAYIHYIIRRLLVESPDQKAFTSEEIRDTNFVFPLPPCWTSTKWNAFHGICKKAISNFGASFTLASESMCSAVDILTHSKIKLFKESLVIVIDLGGLTTDFAALRRTENGFMAVQVDMGTHDPVGSQMINENYNKVLSKLFGKENFAKMMENPKAREEIELFEMHKKNEKNETEHRVNIEFLATHIGVRKEVLAKYVNEQIADNKMECVEVDKHFVLHLKKKFLRQSVFGPVNEKIRDLCKDARKKLEGLPGFGNATVFVCGGFSQNEAVRRIITEVFTSDCTTTPNPEQCVAKGSVSLATPRGDERFNVNLGMKIADDEEYALLVKANDPVSMLSGTQITILAPDYKDGRIPYSLATLDNDGTPLCVLSEDDAEIRVVPGQKFARITFKPSSCQLDMIDVIGSDLTNTTFVVPDLFSSKFNVQ